jgi:NAD(P)-dependent dehydrogenase (short-subunit alcohol dehydrogenase family)
MSDDPGLSAAPGPLEGRIALITGASRGIGYHASKAFAAAGAHVIAVARTTGGLEELDDEITALGSSATLVPLDLTDYDGIDRLGGAIHERWGKLDVFFANAGILGSPSPLGHVEPKEWDQVIAVNVTANWRLIRSLDPLLRASDAGRVIVMSSGVTRSCRPFMGTYSASKAAVEALARTYANETEKTPIRVVVVHPGPMRTAMRARAMPGEDPMSQAHPAKLAPHLIELASPDFDKTGVLFDFPTKSFLDFRAPK